MKSTNNDKAQERFIWEPDQVVLMRKTKRVPKGNKAMIIHAGYKGSASSGNYAHMGRPGKEGGSLPKAGGAAVGGGAPSSTSNQASNTTSSIPLPRLSIPTGEIPPEDPKDVDGKQAYSDWYASLKTKPSLGDALAMRKYFADRAAQVGQAKGAEDAKKRASDIAAREEVARNAPKVLTPKEKKAQETAAKKAAAAAAKNKKALDAAAAKKKKADEAAAKKAAAAAAKKPGTSKKPSEDVAAARKKAADDKKAAADAKKTDADEKKAAAAAEKLAAQEKVAAAVGMSADGFGAFKYAVDAIKAGGKPDAAITNALVGVGLLSKSGNDITVPPAALAFLNAILAADAIKAKAALDKLRGTKEIGQVRMRKVTKYVIETKGSSTSGNHGHAGIPGKRGGSAPKGSGVVSASAAHSPDAVTGSDGKTYEPLGRRVSTGYYNNVNEPKVYPTSAAIGMDVGNGFKFKDGAVTFAGSRVVVEKGSEQVEFGRSKGVTRGSAQNYYIKHSDGKEMKYSASSGGGLAQTKRDAALLKRYGIDVSKVPTPASVADAQGFSSIYGVIIPGKE